MVRAHFGGGRDRRWSTRRVTALLAVFMLTAAVMLLSHRAALPEILISSAHAAETRMAPKKAKKRERRKKKTSKRRKGKTASKTAAGRVTAVPRLREAVPATRDKPGKSEAKRADKASDTEKSGDRDGAATGTADRKAKSPAPASAKPPGDKTRDPEGTARAEKAAEKKPKKAAPAKRTKRGIDLAVPAELLDATILRRLGKAFRRASRLPLRARAANPDQVNALLKSGGLTAAILSRGADGSDPAGDAMAAFQPVFYVDLFVVGPKKDPADIKGMVSLPDAMKAIARSQSTFLSAPLGHGINRLERRVWQEIGVQPVAGRDTWYVATGAVAAKSTLDLLIEASQRKAYMIIDRATWLESGLPGRKNRPLDILVRDDPRLQLVYGIVVRGSREADPGTEALKPSGQAIRFRRWLTGKAAAKIINSTVINGARPYLAEHGLNRETDK